LVDLKTAMNIHAGNFSVRDAVSRWQPYNVPGVILSSA
jgi:hypothetical protein